MNLKEELHELFKRAVMGRMDAVERLVELIHPAVQHHAEVAEAAPVALTATVVPVPVDPSTHSLPLPAGEIEPGTVISATPAVVVAEAPAGDLLDTSAPAVAADPAPVVAEPTDAKA